MRSADQLGWYRHFVRNRSVGGSLFTLLHLPFMLAFVSLTIFGALPLRRTDLIIMTLSILAVALVLYGEHLLDDTTPVGKPWDTVFSDASLRTLAAIMFILAAIIAWFASDYIGSPLPLIAVVFGVGYSILYGLEVWKFHAIAFGAVGMGVIPPFSYLAQTLIQHIRPDLLVVIVLFALGAAFGYVKLAAYEHTKEDPSRYSWNLLAVIFVMFYSLAALTLIR